MSSPPVPPPFPRSPAASPRAQRWLPVLLALVIVGGAVAAYVFWPRPKPQPDMAAVMAANTRGVARMEQYDYAEAEKAFEEASRLEPDWLPARINLAIALLNENTDATKARAEELRAYARQRAVYAYTHPGNSLQTLVDSKGTVDALRRQQLLDQANQTDNDVVKKLAAVNVQLKSQQSDLEREEQQQQQIADQLDAKLAAPNAKQAEVAQAVTDLQHRLDTEISVANFVDASEKARPEQ